MSEDQQVKDQVRELLLDHRGADDAITAREINDEVDLDTVGSFPSTRAVIRELVLDEQIPVAGDHNGYYVIQDQAELEEYVDNLENRVMQITERKFAVQRAALEWDEEILSEDSDLL